MALRIRVATERPGTMVFGSATSSAPQPRTSLLVSVARRARLGRGVLHAKIVTAHREDGIVHMYGSANLTVNAMRYNVETLPLSVHDEPERLQQLFERAWANAAPMSVANARYFVKQAFAEGRPIDDR